MKYQTKEVEISFLINLINSGKINLTQLAAIDHLTL